MSALARLRRLFGGSSTDQRTGEHTGEPGSYQVLSPKRVTEDSALQQSAVWACIKLMAGTVGSLPLEIHARDESDASIARSHRLTHLIRNKPNAHMTSMEFRECMMLNYGLHGNAFAHIQKSSTGRIIGLWPLSAAQTKVELLSDGSLVYMHQKGSTINVIAAENMLHIKQMGNGIVGLSTIGHARNSIGLALAAEDFAARYFVNSGRPGGILVMDQILKKDQREELRKAFMEKLEGTDNAHKFIVLEGGMKYDQTQLDPASMQLIEVRRNQLEDIARFWGIPSILINDNKDTTSWGAGIEQVMLGWLSTTLGPLLVRWETSLQCALLTPSEQLRFEFKFDISALHRTDTKGLAESLRSLVNAGLITRNEGRAKLNLPPVKGGDELTTQINQAPIDALREAVNE